MSVWDGKAPERIAAFIKKHGHEALWSYLRANPRVPLIDLADQIGDVAAIQLQQLAVGHCFKTKQMSALVRDLLARQIHRELPKGWGSADDFTHFQAVSIDGFPAPYDELATLTGKRLKIIVVPPAGWLPDSGDDPLIVRAFENALDALPAETQLTIKGGQRVLRPGEAAWAKIEDFWDAVSIGDGATVFETQFRALPPGVGHLLATQWFQSETRNGGFHQFFHNSTAMLAPEAVAGLRALGLNDCADLLVEAMRFFGAEYPRDQNARIAALDMQSGNRREEWDPFFKLDQRNFDLLDNEAGGYELAADRFAATL